MQSLPPKKAFDLLNSRPDAVFVDCRSDAEFYFVGHAVGSTHVAWYDGPDWELNPHFVGEVKKLAGQSNTRPVVLMCRSGKRSLEAGEALEKAGFKEIYNVMHGFEGDLNDKHQRGKLNGWRFDGLPWEQL